MLRLLLAGLTILFVALKLLEKIDWSWWLVLSPLLISCVIVFIVICISSYMNVKKQERAKLNRRRYFK